MLACLPLLPPLLHGLALLPPGSKLFSSLWVHTPAWAVGVVGSGLLWQYMPSSTELILDIAFGLAKFASPQCPVLGELAFGNGLLVLDHLAPDFFE